MGDGLGPLQRSPIRQLVAREKYSAEGRNAANRAEPCQAEVRPWLFGQRCCLLNDPLEEDHLPKTPTFCLSPAWDGL